MNRPADLRFTQIISCLASILLAICLVSCGRKTSQPSSDETQATLDLQSVFDKYETTKFYADQAKVVLHYSLNGTPFEEIHPCESHVIRGQFTHLKRFKIDLVADDQISVARVLDPVSGNMGGQVVCRQDTAEDFSNSLLKDPIAQHFFNGTDDIPWSDELNAAQVDQLLSIPRQLFRGRPPAWMNEENLVETTRAEVDGTNYIDLVFESRYGRLACRFEEVSQALVGIRFPASVLSAKISSSPGIRDVSLAILFQQTSFEELRPSPLRLAPQEHPVKTFVKLPEEFPSKAIGEHLQAWGLVDGNNQAFVPQEVLGSPAVFLYGLPNQLSLADRSLLQSLAQQCSFAKFHWISPTPTPEFQTGSASSRMSTYFDTRGTFLQSVAMNDASFVLVTNAKGIIQFIAKRDAGWLEKIEPVLLRVRQGDDVAREMHTEYAKYFTEYQSALQNAQAQASVIEYLSQFQ